MDVGNIEKEKREEAKAAQKQEEKQSFFQSLFSNLFKSSNPEAEKKRKNFKVFAQYLFQNSKDITPKEAIVSQMKKWKDEWVEASIPKKIVKGLELVPEQILYMGFGAAVIGVRTIDFFRRVRAGKKFEKRVNEAGYGDVLDEIVTKYRSGENGLDPFNREQIAHGAAIDLMQKMEKESGGKSR